MTSLSRRTLFAGTAAAALAAPGPASAAPAPASYRQALDYAVAKLRAVAPTVTSFPQGTKFEKWTFDAGGGWVGGFWPGLLWMAYLDSGEDKFRALAQESALRLAPRRTDTGDHDLGFLFSPSWVTAWRLTGDSSWRDGAVTAADSLIKRYNPAGRFIRAWGKLGTDDRAGRVIVDTMMNLDLLCFASQATGDRKYVDIAVAHAQTTAAHLVRPDGSTCHVFDFDPATGAPIGQNTVQGYSPTSCWSRGQSWAIYGYTRMHHRTGRAEFLSTAREVADWALDHLDADGVPVWDYRSPLAPNDIKDSSAGAITACGLLDLARATGIARYRTTALRILDALCRTCLTTRSTRAEAVLARGTRNRPSEDGVEISLPYGDYYLMEGLLRVLRPDQVAKALDL
ncbi:glycoside hydrolase family 88 protein [Kutzneria viridogrisea]|uniref:Unsaturated chondroitin disaccharide hydrolase n=1 Tax=Kutzneria viridogrisea TaxID=47990 RepID=A0ABR6BWK1_9PSEU|nr:unsaturated chondroitin disaccharide hydrolase [Kutzneria viridogrisea]